MTRRHLLCIILRVERPLKNRPPSFIQDSEKKGSWNQYSALVDRNCGTENTINIPSSDQEMES